MTDPAVAFFPWIVTDPVTVASSVAVLTDGLPLHPARTTSNAPARSPTPTRCRGDITPTPK